MGSLHKYISLALLTSLGSAAVLPVQAMPWSSPGSWSRAQPRLVAAQGSTIDSLLQLTNTERSRARLSQLSLNDELSKAAQRHAEDMARSGQFSHTGANGSRLGDRVKATNYRYRSVGENLFMQSPRNSPAVAVEGWMNSRGHRENLLNGQFTEIGLGYAESGGRHYYVQVFGRPLRSSAAQSNSQRPGTAIAQATQPSTQTNEKAATREALLRLTNQARSNANRRALTQSAQLQAAAQKHAEDMARSGKFSHTGSNGSGMGDRIRAENYRFRRVAENIAYRAPFNDAEGAIESWLESTGHRRNMLNGQFTEIGLGYATDGERHYYVQVFGTPR